jgi:phosphoribosylformylglycinamidine (FGAM) synthase PurS component
MEKEFNIYIGNENIQNVNIQKLLGICLDHNLDWKNQIDDICKKYKLKIIFVMNTNDWR